MQNNHDIAQFIGNYSKTQHIKHREKQRSVKHSYLFYMHVYTKITSS